MQKEIKGSTDSSVVDACHSIGEILTKGNAGSGEDYSSVWLDTLHRCCYNTGGVELTVSLQVPSFKVNVGLSFSASALTADGLTTLKQVVGNAEGGGVQMLAF